ncbi:hypothetical protein EUTSA_v10024721mg [Eutrema salsugineum]|uniref:ENTH domain-containing protein n=1 Tax=Eutrema salsugineum TaxID=72664 RepID=V4MHC8_EUTSA|nr:hypothetical protein EUTSA_v10024721mg [Eutrema salsugineum]
MAISFRKAVGALKDSTTVSIAKVNSEFKDLDVAIVKATNHVESAPKERHIRKIFSATSVTRPRADVAYCIHALAKRLSKTHNWVVAIKVLIVIHRTLREGDPTFREEFLNYSHRGHILRISNFKDDTSPLAWDCSAWIRTYALFLEERLECYRVLKYDIEAERLPKGSGASSKVDFNASQTYRTRMLSDEELLEQLPALQQLLYRLIGCKPEGAAYSNYLIQYALALVLKESFKIYCAINDGIINLVDLFFEMSRHDAVKALNIYKRAGQQAENLADFYEYCKGLELARNFQFPTLRQPPPSFIATMEDYIKEAPQSGSVQKKLEYQEKEEEQEQEEEHSPQPEEPAETDNQNENTEAEQPLIEEEEEEKEKVEEEDAKPSFLIDTDDLLGLGEINPKAAEIEDRNALALAIYPPGHEAPGPSNSLSLIETGGSGWELALVTPQNNNNNIARPASDTKLAGGFDKLLLDSLYEDDSARRQIQLTNAGYGHGGTDTAAAAAAPPPPNPFEMQQDPFSVSNNIAPPTNVQMAMQQQQMMMMHQSPYNYSHPQDHHHHQHNHQFSAAGSSPSNPFGDPFLALPPPPGSAGPQQQNSHHHMLL